MRAGFEPREGAGGIADALFLAGVVLLSALPYLFGLGFYSDDYWFFSRLHHQGAVPFLESRDIAPRPLMGLYIVTLFKLFGYAPLPGHIINHLLLAAAVLLFHASLRRVGLPRLIAVALPLVFLSLPHSSTVRFWFAAYQIVLSAALFFLCLYASVRFARASSGGGWAWLLLASLAAIGFPLAYEIFLPFLPLVPLFAWLPGLLARSGPRDDGPRRRRRLLLLHLLLFSLIAIAVWRFKLWAYGGYRLWEGDFHRWLGTVHWMVEGVLRSTFVEQGAKLPLNVTRLLEDYWRPTAVAAAFAGFVVIFAWLRRIERATPRPPGLGVLALLAAWGAIVFAGGYVAFLNNFNIGFSPTGIANRVALASSVGLAALAVAAVLLLGRGLPRGLRAWAVPSVLAAGCALGLLINATLGVLWTEAAMAQRQLLSSLRAELPEIPSGTALLMDGICPFVGPGPVFESSWDLAGTLQILYDDPTLRADIVKPNIVIGPEAVETTLYDVLKERYPYGPLLVFNAREQRVWPLPDHAAAEAYFARFDPAETNGCAFTDGGGVNVYRGGS